MMYTPSIQRILFSLSVLILLDACSSTPEVREPPPVFEEVIVEEPEPVALTADQLLQQAEDAEPEAAASLLLEAAYLLYGEGRNTEAENVVGFIDGDATASAAAPAKAAPAAATDAEVAAEAPADAAPVKKTSAKKAKA